MILSVFRLIWGVIHGVQEHRESLQYINSIGSKCTSYSERWITCSLNSFAEAASHWDSQEYSFTLNGMFRHMQSVTQHDYSQSRCMCTNESILLARMLYVWVYDSYYILYFFSSSTTSSSHLNFLFVLDTAWSISTDITEARSFYPISAPLAHLNPSWWSRALAIWLDFLSNPKKWAIMRFCVATFTVRDALDGYYEETTDAVDQIEVFSRFTEHIKQKTLKLLDSLAEAITRPEGSGKISRYFDHIEQHGQSARRLCDLHDGKLAQLHAIGIKLKREWEQLRQLHRLSDKQSAAQRLVEEAEATKAKKSRCIAGRWSQLRTDHAPSEKANTSGGKSLGIKVRHRSQNLRQSIPFL